LDKGFWRWVADNPQLPIEITEGAKKAGCLLAHGYISICVTGVWNSKEKKKLKAIASLAPFLVKGRPIHLVFDSDIVVKKQVQEALKHTGYLAVKQGCIVGVATWEYTEETKGVDDLIKNKGIEEFERIMDELQPFKEWLKSIAAKDKNDEVLLRLNSKKLIKYVRSKYRDRLRLNKLKQRIELDGVEVKVEFAYLYLAENDNIDCSKSKGIDVFSQIAEENAYHPVINYLGTVAKEISPISLDNLSQRYFGTTDPLYDIFLKRTLIAAVARVYHPGSKHDTTLVLQGEQGVGKSTFFDVLGGDYFDDSMGDGSKKDDLVILHKCWIQEWGEIERTFSKKHCEELKAFITRRSDTFRPPYGRTAFENPRQNIIVGTANSTEFLVDATGNRRYWIIPIVKDKIPLDMLREERDSIWAAAVHAYRNGESWWLTDAEEALSKGNNQKFQIIDEWQGAIADYLEHRDRVSITEILEKVMAFDLGDIDRRSQMRVANILTCLKWEKVGQQKHQGKRQVVWKPTTPPPSIEEVLQAERQRQQGLSTPTIPSIPNSNIISENVLAEKKQQDNKKLEEQVQQNREVSPSLSSQQVQPATPNEKSPAIPVDWQSYPYNSQDTYTLQNRANKVKERVLGCGTNNELISLHAEGKASEPEINWIKANYLNQSQLAQLNTIEGTTQGNLFSQQNQPDIIQWEQIKEEIDSNMKRLGWSKKQGKQYLIKRYGKTSRLHLTDAELIEFRNFLKSKVQ
nr:VapE family protein [Xenococcaceae cyanobacterium MO_167.B27]